MRTGKNFRLRNILALLLCGLLLFCAGCGAQQQQVKIEHSDIKFSEIEYVRPDTNAIYEKIDQAMELVSGIDTAALIAAWEEIEEDLADFSSQYSYAQLCSYMNTQDKYYAGETERMAGESEILSLKCNELGIAILDSAHKAGFVQEYGEEYAEEIREQAKYLSPKMEELRTEEQRLLNEYNETVSSLTITVEGKEIPLMEVMYREDLLGWMVEATEILNDAVGPIFVELVDVRNRMAQELGLDSYTEYAYYSFGRDYTPEQVQELYATIKTYYAPLFYQATILYFTGSPAQNQTYPWEETVAKMQEITAEFSPEMGESFAYLLNTESFDNAKRDNKQEGAFTTFFRNYNMPFLFMTYDEEDESSVSTLVHEFGHYNSFYQMGASDCLDLCEIDSQGLEVLFSLAYYEDIMGTETASYLKNYTLFSMVYAVLTGFMEDEFQQIIYANPGMTLEEINAVYAQLEKEYSLPMGIVDGKGWVYIHHTFQQPLYYVSYAMSALPSLELLVTGDQNFGAAKQLYEQIVARDPNAQFRETLEVKGFGDVLDRRYLQEFSSTLRDLIKRWTK